MWVMSSSGRDKRPAIAQRTMGDGQSKVVQIEVGPENLNVSLDGALT